MNITVEEVMQKCDVSLETINMWAEHADFPRREDYHVDYIDLLEWVLKEQPDKVEALLAFGDTMLTDHSRLYEALCRGKVHYDVQGETLEEVIHNVVTLLPVPRKTSRATLEELLVKRERMMSTSIGGGIALPHVRNPEVLPIKQASITACFLRNPLACDAVDGKPISVFFVFLSPSTKAHLQLLSKLVFCLQSVFLRECLQKQASAVQILGEFRVLEQRLAAG